MQFSVTTKHSFNMAAYLIVGSFIWSVFGSIVTEMTKSSIWGTIFSISNAFCFLALCFFIFKMICMGIKDAATGRAKPMVKSKPEVKREHRSKPATPRSKPATPRSRPASAQSKPASAQGYSVIYCDYPDADNSDLYYFNEDYYTDVRNSPKSESSSKLKFVCDCI